MSQKRNSPGTTITTTTSSSSSPEIITVNKKSPRGQRRTLKHQHPVYTDLPYDDDDDERINKKFQDKKRRHHKKNNNNNNNNNSNNKQKQLEQQQEEKMPTCRLLPHGSYSLIPAVLTSMAWLASLFQDGCDYSRLTDPAVVQNITGNPDVPWLEVGLNAYREPILNTKTGHWEVVYTGLCDMYPDTVPQDAYWISARAFDFLALVLGGGGTFFLWFSGCCVFSPGTWRMTGYEVMLAAIFQALSFLFFKTAMCQQNGGGHCDLFWGSKADIVSTIFWTFSALSIFCHYPAPKDNNGGDGVWVQDGNNRSSSITTGPTVELSNNTLSLDTSEPIVTTAAAATIPSGTDDDRIESTTSTPAGQSSHQESSEMRRRQQKEVKADLRDIEIT